MGRLRNAGGKINPFSKDDDQVIDIAQEATATDTSADKPGFMSNVFNKNDKAVEPSPEKEKSGFMAGLFNKNDEVDAVVASMAIRSHGSRNQQSSRGCSGPSGHLEPERKY